MAVPKSRTSRMKKHSRSANWKLDPKGLIECPQCHELKASHVMCPKCGYYNGELVKAPKQKTE
ncbi:MAG TPA: 50S ribosomal protein L32 [Clostridia bacterium]|nr:50S ribosomal protein L32 [Clostridia bacterium]